MTAARLIPHCLRALRRYPLRTGFIMLTSFVGVAALTFVLSVGQGARKKMLTTVRQIFGDNAIIVGAGGHLAMSGPRPDAARLTIDDIDAVVQALPQIDTWDPQQTLSASVRRGNAGATVRVLGQSERSVRVWGRGVARGAFFDALAVRRLDRVAVIGETVARDLFGQQDPLGAELQIESVPFTVIGVLERFGTDLHGMDRDNEIVLPITTLMRRTLNVDSIALAKLHLRDGSPLAEVTREIRQQLRTRHALATGQPDDFNLLTPVEVQQMMRKAQRIISLYVPLAALVVLLVGGMVAATLMLGAVNARTAEIGVRCAVGAQPGDIARQFLVETTATVVGGGLVGIVVGLVASQLVAARLELTGTFSWVAILLGFALSVATGLLAGVLPARRAAKLPPVEALR
ncbi:MAG: ABC transporter permease [Opitutae bacterium]|nr:ABC transporter permease [Opitutae bacterium]